MRYFFCCFRSNSSKYSYCNYKSIASRNGRKKCIKTVNKEENKETESENDSPKDIITAKEPIKSNNDEVITFDRTKGRQPAIEIEYQEYVQKEVKSQDQKNSLILIYNKIAANNRKGSHILDKKTVENSNILSLLLKELRLAKEDGDISKIIDKYNKIKDFKELKDINTDKTKDNSVESLKKNKVVINQSVDEVLSKYEILKKSYLSTLENDSQNIVKNQETIDNFLIDLSNENETVSNKTLTKLNKKYSNYLLALAKAYTTVAKDNKDQFYADIANGEITEPTLKDWDKYSEKIELDFNKFKDLHEFDVPIPQGYINIAEMIKCGYIKDFSIKKVCGEMNLKLSLSDHGFLTSKIKALNDFYKNISPVTLEGSESGYITEEDLLEELKRDYQIKRSSSDYRKIISYLYGQKHQIRNVESFDIHRNSERTKDLLKIINSNRIFKPELFTLHSKLRFVERFVLSQNINYRKFDVETRNSMSKFINSLNKSLNSNVNIATYNRENLFAPQIKFQEDDGSEILITIDNDNRIHTLFKLK